MVGTYLCDEIFNRLIVVEVEFDSVIEENQLNEQRLACFLLRSL